MFLHRYKMEQHIGRKLDRAERVHHINIDTLDNSIKNLHLFKDIREHQYAHRSVDLLIKPLMDMGAIVFRGGRYVLA